MSSPGCRPLLVGLLSLAFSWSLPLLAVADGRTSPQHSMEIRSTEKLDDWLQGDRERVAVDHSVINGAWQPAPFASRHFDLTRQQIRAQWPQLMRALLIPYPSAEYLQLRIETFPELREELGENFDGDYQRLSNEIVHAWRLFLRGDFRAAKEHGMRLGAYGKMPAYFAQILQAIYLTDNITEKHQLLQDAANQVGNYAKVLKKMEGDPQFAEDYVTLRLGYAYAIARIAEDVSPIVAVARNYLFKISGAANDVLDIHERHPVGLAFRAGIDANLIRVMGKAVGRLTFGARQSRARDYFEESFREVGDIAIIHYEFANSLLYMNKLRDAQEALAHLRVASSTPPTFAMEALDSMYANKRLREVELLLASGRSFRAYERHRRRYVGKSDENLYSVLRPPYQPH